MSFNVGTFSSDALVKCYRPPRLSEVYPGNHVMLASGGPDMIVMNTYELDGNTMVACMFEKEGVTMKMDFDIRTLTCFGAK